MAMASGLLPVIVLSIAACSSRARSAEHTGAANGPPAPRRAPANRVFDPTSIYASAGLLANGEPLPFVGDVRFLAGRTADTTLVLVALSMANHALTFSPDGDVQRAAYTVTVDIRAAGERDTVVRRIVTQQVVRVTASRETTRTDESVIFQQFVALPPGRYTISLGVRDAGSARAGTRERGLEVPRLGPGTLSTPMAVYRASPRADGERPPALVANPRGMAVFGRDTGLMIYLEGYGLDSATRVALTSRNEKDAIAWRDTVTLARQGAISSAIVTIPLPKLGVGRATLVVSVLSQSKAEGDSARVPLFVSLGEEWAILGFDEMVEYLRYFAPAVRLDALRNATPEGRAAAWTEFLAASDPVPATTEHEGLRAYFARLQMANERYRDESVQGWLTDRGKVFITLGEPDQIVAQAESAVNQRGRAQVWAFGQYQLRLVFIDQTGFGHWRLTVGSEAEFESIARRERGRER